MKSPSSTEVCALLATTLDSTSIAVHLSAARIGCLLTTLPANFMFLSHSLVCAMLVSCASTSLLNKT